MSYGGPPVSRNLRELDEQIARLRGWHGDAVWIQDEDNGGWDVYLFDPDTDNPGDGDRSCDCYVPYYSKDEAAGLVLDLVNAGIEPEGNAEEIARRWLAWKKATS